MSGKDNLSRKASGQTLLTALCMLSLFCKAAQLRINFSGKSEAIALEHSQHTSE